MILNYILIFHGVNLKSKAKRMSYRFFRLYIFQVIINEMLKVCLLIYILILKHAAMHILTFFKRIITQRIKLKQHEVFLYAHDFFILFHSLKLIKIILYNNNNYNFKIFL